MVARVLSRALAANLTELDKRGVNDPALCAKFAWYPRRCEGRELARASNGDSKHALARPMSLR